MLDAELEEQKQAMEELEDELQIVSDAKLRLEVCFIISTWSGMLRVL